MSTYHSQRATAALQKLIEFDPTFGSLSLWCLHRDATAEETLIVLRDTQEESSIASVRHQIAPAYTDGRVIYYGSQFERWNLEEQMAVCAHEILHIALQHIPRASKLSMRFGTQYSHLIFNIAADALINESLTQAGYRLPQPHVSLNAILKEVLLSDQKADAALATLDVESLYAQLFDVSEQGGKQALALNALSSRLAPDVSAVGKLSTEDELSSAEWQQRLDRALRSGANAGKGLGSISSRLGDIPKSFTPWEVILRRMVTKIVTYIPQYRFEAPTRRWLALDAEAQKTGHWSPAFEPGRRKALARRGKIAVCVDVSGSISQSMLARFASEIEGISRRTGAEIILIIFDHGIQLIHELTKHNLLEELNGLDFHSGGGTSFIEPIEEALKHDPSIIVVLTDLVGQFGPKPGRTPVVWACCHGNTETVPFGRVIYLSR
ncbi:vWA domain-containing protein [Pseudovibrio ascidiaceicola]|uniref:vWA domain-containing protein n=1 Tax=Pseudovibrio ascidiaceicola TaxID=285279 RepID=UPI003D35B45F